eukprot:s3109_g3.t1
MSPFQIDLEPSLFPSRVRLLFFRHGLKVHGLWPPRALPIAQIPKAPGRARVCASDVLDYGILEPCMAPMLGAPALSGTRHSRRQRGESAREVDGDVAEEEIILTPPDVVECSLVIHRWAKQKDADGATSLLHLMRERLVTPDVVSYNSAVNACARGSCIHQAVALMEEMQCYRLVPTEVSFNSILHACARSGDVARAQETLAEMARRRCVPGSISYNSALGACAKAGDSRTAQTILREMPRSLRDVVTYNTALNAAVQEGDLATAEDLLADLQQDLRPDVISYSSLMSGYAKAALAERAESMLTEMSKSGIRPNAVAYNAVIDALSGTSAEEAEEVLKEMRRQEGCMGQDDDKGPGRADAKSQVVAGSLRLQNWRSKVFGWGDANGLDYHHRVLLHKISAGRWVTLTPDLDLEIHDLSVRRHIVLGRHSAFPDQFIDESYIFEELSRNELERQKRLAKTMGSILDDGEIVDVAASQWVVADPASSRFGKPIPYELVQDVAGIGAYGVVQWDAETEFVREMNVDEISEFVESRKESLGDLRTLGDHRDGSGKRYLSFKDALNLLRQSDFEDWPFVGPRAVREYLEAIRDGPGDLPSYHMSWVRSSGVTSGSAIVHEHHSLCEALRLALSKDQLDVSNLASYEHLTRRLLTLEIAVARSPGNPDFTGLEVVAEAPIASTGQAYVSSMSTWITEKLKEKANIQKQSRLFKEEFSKKSGKGIDDSDDKSKRWKKQKGKGGKSSGGADGSAAT